MKYESQSWKGHTNAIDNVYSLGSMDCNVNEAYTARTWLADSRHRDARLDATFHRLKQLLWYETNLILMTWQM